MYIIVRYVVYSYTIKNVQSIIYKIFKSFIYIKIIVDYRFFRYNSYFHNCMKSYMIFQS